MGKIIDKVRQREFDVMLNRGAAMRKEHDDDFWNKRAQTEALDLADYACKLATKPVSAGAWAFLRGRPTGLHHRWLAL